MKKVIFFLFILISQFVNAQNDELIKACMAGNLDAVKAAVDKGADVNYKAENGTPLNYAVLYNDVVKYLLEKGAKPNEGTNNVLVSACVYGNADVIKTLLDAGADPNKPMVTDISASIQKTLDAEKAKGKSANKDLIKIYEGMVEKMKATPVTTYAMSNLITQTNCLECMQLLADKGAKMDMVNSVTGGNLLSDFASSGKSKKARIEMRPAIVTSIEKYGMTIPDWFKNPNPDKMASPDEIVKFLVSKGVDINGVSSLKNTPLMDAMIVPAGYMQSEVIVALINNGANVKTESMVYGKPMLIAAGNGMVDVMDALLAKGANINDAATIDDKTTGQSLKGVTPLMWAAANDHLDAVKFLLSKGADLGSEAYGRSLNVKTKCMTKVEGKTAIFYAIESGNMEIVKALVETGHYWGKSMVTKEMKHEQDMGALTFVTCFEVGAHIPSHYAKALGYEEIQKYLKSKMI